MRFKLFSASKFAEMKVGEKVAFKEEFPQFFTRRYDLTIVQKEEAVAENLALYRDSGHEFYTHSVQEKGKVARGQIMHIEGSEEDIRVWLEQLDALEVYYGLPRGQESIRRVRAPTEPPEHIDCFRATRLDQIPKQLILGKLVRIN